MNIHAHDLTKEELDTLSNAYSELFQALLRNIIAGYSDNPEKIGEIFAQWSLYEEFCSVLNKKKYTEVLGWECSYQTEMFLREITCFRFLCDWTLDNSKTEKEKQDLGERYRKIMVTEQVINWYKQLCAGYFQYIRDFQKTHSNSQSRHFFEEHKSELIRSTLIWIPYEKDLLLPIEIRIYTCNEKTSYRAEYIFDERLFLVRHHDCSLDSAADVSRRIETELESKEENPFRDMLINTITIHMKELYPDDFKKRILERTTHKIQ